MIAEGEKCVIDADCKNVDFKGINQKLQTLDSSEIEIQFLDVDSLATLTRWSQLLWQKLIFNSAISQLHDEFAILSMRSFWHGAHKKKIGDNQLDYYF